MRRAPPSPTNRWPTSRSRRTEISAVTGQESEPARGAPVRPSTTGGDSAPVLVKATPPFEVRLSGVAGPVDAPFDAATGVLSVEVADTGDDHAICVVPTGWDGECTAADPVDTTSTTTTAPAGPTTPPAAQPLPGTADYTG